MSSLKNLPKTLRVSTMTGKGAINSNINLDNVYKYLEIDANIKFIDYKTEDPKGFHHKNISEKKKRKLRLFYNQITILILINNDINNIKLFNNGSISMTGVKSEENGHQAIKLLNSKLLEISKNNPKEPALVNLNSEVIKYEIVLINSDYDIGYEIKRSDLHQLLVNEYKIFSSFEPCIYPGVNSKYYWNKDYKDNQFKGRCYCTMKCNGKGKGNGNGDCKKVTVSAFQSGSIIITGAQTIDQIIDTYNFINTIFENHIEQLKKTVPHFIDAKIQEPKQNKHKKKIWINKNNIVY